MMSRSLLGFLVLLAGCGSGGRLEIPPAPVPTFAVDVTAAGWTPVGPMRTYTGDALYDYFGDAAAVHQEYGCLRVRVQDFRNFRGELARAEFLETQTPEGAYGLYTLKCRPGGEPLELGGGAWREPYAVHFWRGRYQVTVRARRSRLGPAQGLEYLAEAVEQGLEGTTRLPDLVARLPEEGLLPDGRVYVLGPAGLRQALGEGWSFPPPERGAVGTYTHTGGRHRVAVLEYEDEETARQAAAKAAPGGAVQRGSTVLAVLPLGRFLYAYLGPPETERVQKVLLGVKRRDAELHQKP